MRMKTAAAAIVAVILAAAGIFLFMGAAEDDRDYVATVNNEKIYIGEYLIYLREQQIAFEETGGSDIWDTDFDGISAIGVAKQNALDSITYVKLLSKEATESGIVLTQSELTDCEEVSRELYLSFGGDNQELMVYEDAYNVLVENVLLQKLYGVNTGDYVFDQAEFQDYYESHVDAYRDIYVQYIWIGAGHGYENGEEAYLLAEEIREEARDGENLAALMPQLAEGVQAEYTIQPVSLRQSGLAEFNYNYVASLDINEVSQVVAEEDGYYVFYVVDKNEPGEEAAAAAMEDYIQENQKARFDQKYSSLLNSAVIEKNSQVWDGISIY